ncbi:taste receptor type 2 member 40-like [Natator depressus]|uniref:taste receptor type 2 member 40-like n=1 Tax=Natator depressus TaxID=27790 RepID=UPI003EB7884F
MRVPIIAVIIAVIEISTGLVGNGFIVVINGMDWMKSRKLSSCDMILSCLSMSRIIMQGAAVVSHSYSFFCTETRTLDNLFITFRIIQMFASITTGWFVSCLSVFCCLKIASFTQRLFLRMKQRISGMVPQLLLGSLLLALLTCIPSIWANYDFYLSPEVGSIVVTLYPSGHSIILILINPKLKQASVKILHHVKQHWSQRTY